MGFVSSFIINLFFSIKKHNLFGKLALFCMDDKDYNQSWVTYIIAGNFVGNFLM